MSLDAPPPRSTREEAWTVAARFAVDGPLVAVEPYGGGLINDSWEVRAGRSGPRRYLLQRVNRFVFRKPLELMANFERVVQHVAAHLAREGVSDRERRVLTLVPTSDGRGFAVDPRGEVWRLFVWIEGTHATEQAESPDEARETARAFGRFVRQLSDLPGPRLHETIPGFHDTPARITALDRAVAADAMGRAGAARREIDAVLARRTMAVSLADRLTAGELRERPVHSDAKIANILFDERSREALCVVDLDTVMPGLALHDFGDLVRSMVSPTAEDTRDLEEVGVRVPVFAALAEGFVAGAGDALSPLERSLLVTGAEVIVLEQAARFLTDHLGGDRYYRTCRPGHNLDRTRTQLRLLESLEREGETLRAIAASF